MTLLPALETGAYTITPSGGAGEEYTLDLLYDDDANGFFHSLTSAAPASVTLSSTGTLTTKTDASAAQTLTSAYNGSQIAADGVTVSGETTGFTARLENGAVSVTSQQETQAELTLSSGLKEQTQTLPLGSSAVTLQADASDKTCEITRGSETLASVSLGYAVVFDARGGSPDADAVRAVRPDRSWFRTSRNITAISSTAGLPTKPAPNRGVLTRRSQKTKFCTQTGGPIRPCGKRSFSA